ncbi:DUF6884 domain-containing protein [Haloarcula marina]|uniref:DUF6884 domain-containing protein n=1 Tax=Haloarcula marina TaxID=2961574 RepID=UPI0020B757DE|nr:DUF6884 domain-containing protein [Halomicroarcula marina]
MEILVLSPCSGDKRYDGGLDCTTVDDTPRADLCKQYPDRVAPAADLYTGDEHSHVSAAVDALSDLATVDWRIVSAGFGVVQPDTPLPAYDCTFSEMDAVRTRASRAGYTVGDLTNAETIQAVGREKGIPQALEETLANEYDLVVVVLGKSYLLALDDALETIPETTTAVAFAAAGNNHLLGACHWHPATETERAALETTWTRLRGLLLREIAASATEADLKRAIEEPDHLQTIWE